MLFYHICSLRQFLRLQTPLPPPLYFPSTRQNPTNSNLFLLYNRPATIMKSWSEIHNDDFTSFILTRLWYRRLYSCPKKFRLKEKGGNQKKSSK